MTRAPNGDDEQLDDEHCLTWISDELAVLPDVAAVALGGSRARGTHHEDSDWDVAVYCRDGFDRLLASPRSCFVIQVGSWERCAGNG